MKKTRFFAIFTLTFLLLFSSCGSSKGKKTLSSSSNDGSSNQTEDVANAKPKKEIGEVYEVGVTPDDYSMDYDTTRLKKFADKLSKFYPKDGVKGIYLNPSVVADKDRLDSALEFVDSGKLNTIVVDVKDDWGNVVFNFDTKNKDVLYATSSEIDAKAFVKKIHKKGIYVIARIPAFKDAVIIDKHNDWGFETSDGYLWANSQGDYFVNPFVQDAREYPIELAELAAIAGFDEIQFDYVRFSEGFENVEADLTYSKGDWENGDQSDGDKRIDAITSFVKKTREEIQDYNIPVGIDVFGYAMQTGRAEGIGQDFKEICNQTDVISSMIYPSHWALWSFDIEKPDLEPYELVKGYLKKEQEDLSEIDFKPQSRPWLQDFTATWIGDGNWMEYDADAVQAQIDAIYEMGQKEYLIWNASGEYSEGVSY